MRNMKGIRLAAAAVIGLIASIIIITQASAQLPTVAVSSATINLGGTASISLSANDIASTGLGAWEIGVVYDSSVVTATACSPQAGSLCNEDFASNRVQVVGANASGLPGTNVLADITFRCSGEGTTDLTIIVDEFSDATIGGPQPINPGINAGRITCQESEGLPDVPTPRPTATDDDDDGDGDDDDDGDNGVSILPKSGAGTGSSSVMSWLIAALATLGLVTLVSLGASRMFAQRADTRE